jgi:outer membrane protein TolC
VKSGKNLPTQEGTGMLCKDLRFTIYDLRFTRYLSRTTVLFACFLFYTAAAQESNQVSPIDLPSALRLAGAQNLEIQIARERLKEAEAERTSATERFFPWIAPSVTYHRRDGVAQAVPAGTISDAHFQSYSPGVALAAQLDLGDAIYKNLAAKQLVKASDQALETQRQDTVLFAARGYFDLAKSRGLVEVANAALKTSQEYEQQLHAAVEAGIAFKGDELRIQTQTKQYQISLRQAVEQQRVTAVELARVLHLDSRVELVPQDSGQTVLSLFEPRSAVSPLVEQALRVRPELKESQALILAAQENKNGAVYGPIIPSIGAQAFAGGLGGGPDSGPSNLGAVGDYLVGLSWRIGPGGLFDSGRVRASKARLTTAQLSDSKLKDDIVAQVVAALTHLQSVAEQITMAEGKLTFATETLRVTHERKQFGVGVVLEDIQSQQDLDRARSDYVNLLAEYNKAQYTLSRAVGSELGPSTESSR